jgi:hypothetical protein
MNTINFLNVSSERIGFKREVFFDSKVPTDLDNLLFIPIFCDFKHSFIFSSILFDHYKNKTKNSKYIIVCSYPGFSHLFKEADEYWSLSDFKFFKNIYENSNEFENKSKTYLELLRSFNENYRNVINSSTFNLYYKNGFKEKFWKEYEDIILNFPMIPSSAILGKDTLRSINENSGYKVFLHPSIYLNSWADGRNIKVRSNKDFYIELIKYLKSENIFPVIWNHPTGFDLTNEFTNKTDCIFVNEYDISKVLSSIRLTGCTLDLFNDLSWLSKLSRTPSLIFDERTRYFNTKENELYNYTAIETPNKIQFYFTNSIVNGNLSSWKNDIFVNIKNNLMNFLPYLDRDTWNTTSEFNKKVIIEDVRKIKNKKFGTRFIKIPKE